MNMSLSRFTAVCAIAAALLVTTGPSPARAGLSPGLRCAFDKQKITLKVTGMMLACQREALLKLTAVDPACTDAATARLETAFLKIEARGGCVAIGDGPSTAFAADRYAQEIASALSGTCLPAGSICGGGPAPCCAGLLCRGVFGQEPVCG
jgi:hypothetical protein